MYRVIFVYLGNVLHISSKVIKNFGRENVIKSWARLFYPAFCEKGGIIQTFIYRLYDKERVEIILFYIYQIMLAQIEVTSFVPF